MYYAGLYFCFFTYYSFSLWLLVFAGITLKVLTQQSSCSIAAFRISSSTIASASPFTFNCILQLILLVFRLFSTLLLPSSTAISITISDNNTVTYTHFKFCLGNFYLCSSCVQCRYNDFCRIRCVLGCAIGSSLAQRRAKNCSQIGLLTP